LTTDGGPLIVTAALGAADQRHFDALRRDHYPPERNQVAAHLALFHHLPPRREPELTALLKLLAAQTPPLTGRVTGPYALSRGVAFGVEAPLLLALRERVAEWFAADLLPEDAATPRLHITVQNKVTAAAARAALVALAASFTPHPLHLTGFALYRYCSGPWQALAHIPFRGAAR
jgi:hypothetical protein